MEDRERQACRDVLQVIEAMAPVDRLALELYTENDPRPWTLMNQIRSKLAPRRKRPLFVVPSTYDQEGYRRDAAEIMDECELGVDGVYADGSRFSLKPESNRNRRDLVHQLADREC